MAKKFLDVFGEAFEEDTLNDVIPKKRQTASPKRRKKRFMDSLSQINSRSQNQKEKTSKRENRKKSLLDTMEEALDNQVFDQLFPESRNRPQTVDRESKRVVESPFSTMITTDVLDRAREIAKLKGLRVKDVINTALKIYVDSQAE